MGCCFHQRQFFAYARGGAPSIHSLRASPTGSQVLVTTDRCVHLLSARADGYELTEIAFGAVGVEDGSDGRPRVDVLASGVIDCPGRERVVVAYAEVALDAIVGDGGSNDDPAKLEATSAMTAAAGGSGGGGGSDESPQDKMFLCVVDPKKPRNAKVDDGMADTAEPTRFELVAAPTALLSIRAQAHGGDDGISTAFHGVLAFRMESIVAFGFVDENQGPPSDECVRLSSEQFAQFFPQLAEFTRPVLAVETLVSPFGDHGWWALGCADGTVRVLRGAIHSRCLCGPFETRDFHINGPVTSVSLFLTTVSQGRQACNVVVASAIGRAIVFEDVFGSSSANDVHRGILRGSGQFDSIFSVVAADVDLDGQTELLVGTDHQVLLAYKKAEVEHVDPAEDNNTLPSDEVTNAQVTESSEQLTIKPPEQHRWQLMTNDEWNMRVFGGIYSLEWVDLNRDGVPELFVASSTGVYVLEADPDVVLGKVDALLAALQIHP